MKFNSGKNLIIIDIEGSAFLVDTGSPISGTFEMVDKDYKFNVGKGVYSLNYNPRLAPLKMAVDKLIPNNNIVGVIGNDIISNTNLTVDYINSEVWFDLVECSYDIEQTTIPFEYRGGYPFIKINSNGNVLNVVLDSGAHYGYVNQKYLDLSKPVEEIVDYYQNGEIRSNLYSFNDNYHGDISLVGILPTEYTFVTDGVLSLYEFVRPGYCRFDFKKKEFSFTRRFL